MQVEERDNFLNKFDECLKLEDYDQAEKIIKLLRQEYPRKSKYIRSYIKLLKIVDIDRAIEFCKTLMDSDKTGEFHASLISLLMDCRRYDEAMEVISDTLGKNYEDYLSYYNFCFAQINFMSDKSNANISLRAAKQSLELKETFYTNKLIAMIYAELKDFGNTEDYYLKTIELVPDEKMKSICLDFSKACLSLSKYEEAKFYSCCELLNVKKSNLRSLFVIWKNNDYKKLKELFDKINDKENEDFYNMLLAISALDENKNIAFANNLNSIKDEITKKEVLSFLVTIYNREKKYNISNVILSLDDLENSNNYEICYNKVKALFIKRRYDEALELTGALLEKKESKKLFLLKGKILFELAMSDKAEDIFVDLIRESDSEPAKIELASLYTSCGDIVNARKVLYDMKDKDFANTKNAEICIYENRLDEAKKIIKNINSDYFVTF